MKSDWKIMNFVFILFFIFSPLAEAKNKKMKKIQAPTIKDSLGLTLNEEKNPSREIASFGKKKEKKNKAQRWDFTQKPLTEKNTTKD